MTVTIRTAAPSDATALGRVHVRAWQGAYRGLMPQDYLDALDPAARATGWERALAHPHDRDPVLVACVDGEVGGFTWVGAARDDDAPVPGELYVINVDPHHWGSGAGPALLSAGQDHLVALGFEAAYLWVVPGNARARRFYERSGWVADGGEREVDVYGVTVPEIRYRRPLP